MSWQIDMALTPRDQINQILNWSPQPPRNQVVTPREQLQKAVGSAYQPSSNSYQVGGWYGDKGQYQGNGQWSNTPMGSVPSGSSVGSSNVETPQINFDEIYNPIFASYNEAERVLRENELPTQLSRVNNDAANLMQNLTTQRDEGLTDVKTQQQTLDKQKMSAFDAAVRSYNALQQQARVRFGQGSSVGSAANDILSQEFARNQGQIENTYAENFGKLQTYQGQIIKRFNDESIRIERDKQSAISEVNSKFAQAMAQINSQRAMAESEKAARKVQMLQDAIARSNQIADNFKMQQQSLEIWKQQQNYQLTQGYNQLNQQRYVTPANAIAAPQASTIGQSAPVYTETPSPLVPKKKDTEDFWEWLNPFD